MKQNLKDVNSEAHKSENKVLILALISMGLGVASVCPSLAIISELNATPGSNGDYQGGGIYIFLLIFLINAAMSLTSVIAGISALYNVIIAKKGKKFMLIPAALGTILGLPGIASLLILFLQAG